MVGAETSCQICPSAVLERVEGEAIRVVADERGRRSRRREPERKHPDAAVPALAKSLERGRPIRHVGRRHQPPAGLEGEDSPPALGGIGVAGLVHDGERDELELAVHRVAEDQQIDDRKDHRRDHEHGLAPQRQESALTDRRDPEQRQQEAPGRLRAAAHGARRRLAQRPARVGEEDVLERHERDRQVDDVVPLDLEQARHAPAGRLPGPGRERDAGRRVEPHVGGALRHDALAVLLGDRPVRLELDALSGRQLRSSKR